MISISIGICYQILRMTLRLVDTEMSSMEDLIDLLHSILIDLDEIRRKTSERIIKLFDEMSLKDPLIWLLDNPIHVDPKKIEEMELEALDLKSKIICKIKI